jgi:hypothetical protein
MVDSTNALSRLADQPALDAVATPLSEAIRGAYESAGPAGRHTQNAMHGVWLGHPLHPVFTDLPLGAWTTGLVLDAVASVKPRVEWNARPILRSPGGSRDRRERP